MKILALLLAGLMITLHSISQSPTIDSLKKVLSSTSRGDEAARVQLFIQLSDYWSNVDPDSALYFAESGYLLAERKGLTPQMAQSLVNIGWIKINTGAFAEGYEAYTNALTYYTQLKDENGKASVYNGLGVTFGMQEKYTEALPYFLKALTIYEKNQTLKGLTSCYIKIGVLHHKIHQYDKALYNFEKALELTKKTGDKSNAAHAYINIATIYGEIEQYEKSLEATLKAKQIAEEIKSIPSIAHAYLNMGMAYSELKQYALADTNLHKALILFKQLKNQEQISRTYNNIATLYFNKKQFAKATEFIWLSNAIAEELNNKQLLYDNYNVLIEIAKTAGKFEEATNYYDKLLALKDTLFNAEKNNSIEQLKAAHELEKKQITIEELTKDNAVTIRQRNNLLIATACGALLIALLIISLIHIKRNNKLLSQSKKELKELNDIKDKFFSILSHDLRSPMSNILLSIDLMGGDYSLTEAEKKELLDKLKSSTSSALETMDNMLTWGKYQLQNTSNLPVQIKVQEMAERVCRFLHDTANNKSITISNKIVEPFVVTADENQLEFIIRNLLSNALKFSHANSKVEIWARKLNSSICIYIKDFGTGMSKELQERLFDPQKRVSMNGTSGEIGSGLGLILCHEFIKKNNGSLTVKSEPGLGTTFAIKLPA